MLTSSQNPRLKLVKALLSQPKTRRKEGQIVLEGVRLIQDAMAAGFPPEFALYKTGADHALLGQLEGQNIPLFEVDPALFETLSETEHSQGVIAVVGLPNLPMPTNPTFLIGTDEVREPGNLGTILRTAAAAGVDAALLLSGTVDPYNPKALRAGMGAHFRLPIRALNWGEFAADYTSGWRIWLADVDAATPYHQADWSAPTLLLVGNEAHGHSEAAYQYATDRVIIPMARGVESLNTSIASAVLMFEIQRQRGRF